MALFVLSLALGSFAAGVYVATAKPAPYTRIVEHLRDARAAVLDWRSELGLRPPRWFLTEVPAVPDIEHRLVVRHAPEMLEGPTLLAGLFDGQPTLRLIDSDGRTLNTWHIDFFELFPNAEHIQPARHRPQHRWGYLVHGEAALPDGSVIFNITDKGLVKMDRCSRVVWTLPRMTHHSVFLAEDGTLWVPAKYYRDKVPAEFPGMRGPFFEETILQLSAEGTVLREISFMKLLYSARLQTLLSCPGTPEIRGCGFEAIDPTHLNDVEVISTSAATAMPGVRPGDLLVSSRNLNLLIIFDPDDLHVRWWQVGPWQRQHDPDVLPDGVISVYNNNRNDSAPGLPQQSEIVGVEPRKGQWRAIYPKSSADAFFAEAAGNHQHLSNGNVLISELRGRVLEVDPRGTPVWEFLNWFDQDHLGFVVEAQRYESSYFRVDAWSCDGAADR